MFNKKAIFLDRDGVINIEKNYLYKIEDFKFIDGVFDAIIHFDKLGYLIIIVTNQSGIGRGYYTLDDYQKLTKWMLDYIKKATNVSITKVYHCPHTPDDNCKCRKPKIGMIDTAIKEFKINPLSSWLIGDKDSDIQTAINAKIPNHIQVKSGHSFDKALSKAKYITNTLFDTISIIKS